MTAEKVYGLYRLPDLREQLEVRIALSLDPNIEFFMDAANEWYYGIKEGHLYSYEADTQELEDLGRFHEAMQELLESWQ